MAREFSRISMDPQPGECIRFSPTLVWRVSKRTPESVSYRIEEVGAELLEQTVEVAVWRTRIAGGTPCEPRHNYP